MEKKYSNIDKELLSLKQRLEEIKKINKLKKDIIDYFYGVVNKKRKDGYF